MESHTLVKQENIKKTNDNIFVQIASYRDPECQHTVRDLFEKAKNADRIFVGICNQYDFSCDHHLFKFPYHRNGQVRELHVPSNTSRGVCWARHQTQQLWNREKYTLFIDSHTRFVKDWDFIATEMLNFLISRGVQKPVLSSHVPGYTLDGQYDDWLAYLSVLEYPPGTRTLGMTSSIYDEEPTQPQLTAFVCAHFLFSLGELIQEVPYDPYLYFHGEEITLSARMWTSGWDLYHPNKIIAYTLYPDDKDALFPGYYGEIRNLHSENPQSRELDEISLARVRHLLGTEVCSRPEVLLEIDDYGLGHERTLEDYERFSGINFKTLAVQEHTKLGLFFEFPSYARTTSDHDLLDCEEKLLPVYSCRSLTFLLELLKVRTLLDLSNESIPCGLDGFITIKATSTTDIQRTSAQECAPNHKKVYISLDPLQEKLPICDLIYGCNISSKIPAQTIWKFLENVRDSGAQYMLLSHNTPDNILCIHPYYLPPPLLTIPQLQPNNLLALWRVDEIAVYLNAVPDDAMELRRCLVPLLKQDLMQLETLISDNKVFERIISSLFDDWEDSNAYITSDKVSKLLNKQNYLGIRLRNYIFCLFFKVELGRVKERYPFVNTDNFKFAQLFTRQMLYNYIGDMSQQFPITDDTIFVQIAAYRDPQLIPTITDCLEKASYPQNLTFGICWQHDEQEQLDQFKHDRRFKIIEVPWQTSRGACWARYLLQQLYDNEKYTLQIDSHTRFVEGWDRLLLEMIGQIDSKKPLLTAYAPYYTQQGEFDTRPYQTTFMEFTNDGSVSVIPVHIDSQEKLTTPFPARFYSAHFCFAPGLFVQEVQHDPNYYFHGEEISLSVRAFTHGWDMFHPNKIVLWHEYGGESRRKHWDDHNDSLNGSIAWYERDAASHRRNRILLGIDPNEADIDFGEFGLGTTRNLREYEKYAGILFEKQSVQPYTLFGGVPPNPYEFSNEQQWLDSFCHNYNQLIRIDMKEVPKDIEYDFWYTGILNHQGEELYRRDLEPDEISPMLQNEEIEFNLNFQVLNDDPDCWIVWLHSKEQEWVKYFKGAVQIADSDQG